MNFREDYCQYCGANLRVFNRFKIIQPLTLGSQIIQTYEVLDLEEGYHKILKIVNSDKPEIREPLMAAANALHQIHTPYPIPGIPIAATNSFFPWQIHPDLPESLCLVVTKIEGETLTEWLNQGHQLSQTMALNWLRQLIVLIEHFHRHEFIHRDLKPDNIIVQPSGQLAIIDFSTIQQMTWSTITYTSMRGIGSFSEQSYHLNPGTVGYVAPEQSDGRATFVSDLYSIGRTFIHLLTRTPPTSLPIDLKTRKINWRKKAPQIDPLFADLIDRMVELNPIDRPLDGNWILKYLEKIPTLLKRRAILRSKPFRFIVVGVLGLSLSGLIFCTQRAVANYYWLQGNQLQDLGEYQVAQEKYKQALRYQKSPDIYANLAMSCALLNDVDCAEKNFRAALKIDAFHEMANYNFANLLENQSKFEQAEEYYKKAAASNSSSVRYLAINNLSRLQILKGNLDQAIQTLQPFIEQTQDSKTLAAFYKNLGWAALLKKSVAQADQWLKKSLELDPTRTDTHCLLAQVKRMQNDLKGAIPLEVSCLTMPSGVNPEIQQFKLEILKRNNLT